MILTVEELRRHVETDKEDPVLTDMLNAAELAIKGYTHNNFVRVLENNDGQWPMDIKLGVARMMEWDLGTGTKAGIASESISRHSVTYESQTSDNSIMGYPKRLMGFLRPYMCARFGQGVRV